MKFFRIDSAGYGLLSFFYISQRVFVSVEHLGVMELKNDELVKIPQSEAIASYNVTSMLPAPDTQILLVTQQHGIFKYDSYSDFEKWSFETNDFVKGNENVCAASIPSGYVLGSSHN